MKTTDLDQAFFEAVGRFRDFAENDSELMPDAARVGFQDYLYTGFEKEINEITTYEIFIAKCKNRLYKKLYDAKRKIATVQKARSWFNNVFRKYQNKELIEELIVSAIIYLKDRNSLVYKKLFEAADDDELLAEFTLAAVDRLGWNKPTEAPTTAESDCVEDEDEQQEENVESASEGAETAEMTVYTPQEVAPAQEEKTTPVVTVERTVTHEVVTATTKSSDEDEDIDYVDNEADDTVSQSKPYWFKPGGSKTK